MIHIGQKDSYLIELLNQNRRGLYDRTIMATLRKSLKMGVIAEESPKTKKARSKLKERFSSLEKVVATTTARVTEKKLRPSAKVSKTVAKLQNELASRL